MLLNDETFSPHLEWEVLNEPVSITTVNENKSLPKGQKKIVIDRDEDYNLRAVLHFKDPNFRFARKPTEVPGSFIDTFEITGSDYINSHSYILESSHIGEVQRRMDNVENEFLGRAKLIFHELGMKTSNKNKVTHLTEWCLNGPRDHVFSRVTERKVSNIFTRTRLESIDKPFKSVEISRESSSGGVDFLMIKTGDLQFVIEKVPKKIGPNWSTNTGIEYRTIWGGIPDVAKREKLIEICSFVFGRQLLPIGHTLYDKDENVIEAYARNPWREAAKFYCSKPDIAPISIRLPQQGRAETIISQLLPKYLELCESLCLKEALMNYWVSREMPLGANLPILAAGVESIINGWFRYNKPKSKDVFLNKRNFKEILGEEFEHIKNRLLKVNNGDKIVEKILRVNEISGTMERYRVFFEEIKLPINEKEWDAIKKRHIFAHGGVIFDKTDWREIAQRKHTFETLFTKIFLKSLEYSGTFIDRSTIGWPEMQLV